MIGRHRFRADWHDYNGGVYFVTINSHNWENIFGDIIAEEFYSSPIGKIAIAQIHKIPDFHPDSQIWNYVVMPNHVHMVISIESGAINNENYTTSSKDTDTNIGCLKPPKYDEPTTYNHHNSRLSVIIGLYKAGVTRIVREQGISTKSRLWHSRFHEHIIRTQTSLDRIMNYIDNNIANWDKDCFKKPTP